MNSPSSQTWALPTGGFSLSRFSSIHFCRLKALSELMDAILFLSCNGLVSDCFYLNQQMRVRQLVHSNGGSRWTVVIEVLPVHFVVAGEIVHVDQESRDFSQIVQVGTKA